MSKRIPKNLPASIRQRLLDVAKKRKVDFGLILVKYGLERILYRVSRSAYHDVFVLGAAAVLGGLHPKTVERWAREGRIPAYHYFRHWKFRASELEIWIHSHVNSVCHPCRLKPEESDGT